MARPPRWPSRVKARVCCWRRGAPGRLAESPRRLWSAAPRQCTPSHLDVRNRHAVQRAIDELPAEWAEIDVLVNNAGLSRGMEKLYTGKSRRLGRDDRHQREGPALRDARGGAGHGGARAAATWSTWAPWRAKSSTPTALSTVAARPRRGPSTTACAKICWERRCASPASIPGLVETDFSLVRFHGDAARASKVYKGMTPLTAETILRMRFYGR